MSGRTGSRPRRVRLVRVAAAVLLIWLLVGGVLALAVVGYGGVSHERRADVIIVLGAGLNRSGRPGPALTRRSIEGARLYHAGYAPRIICTGGVARTTDRSEASGCADLLIARGVPSSAIFLEERSRSTEENAVYSREIMDANGWRTALIVSDGYHLLRARWIFAEQGIAGFTVPTTDVPRRIDHFYGVTREVVALHWQVFKTLLGLPYTFVPWV